MTDSLFIASVLFLHSQSRGFEMCKYMYDKKERTSTNFISVINC